MQRILIKNGSVILKDRIIGGASVEIIDSKIAAVSSHSPRNDEAVIIDAKGAFVSPGFIDCHIHGKPKDIFSNETKYGTTAFVIAESCAPLESVYKKCEEIKKFIKTSPFGENVLGLRLEGPYISKEKRGAQDLAYIKKPDAKELSEILLHTKPLLKIMTIAPELKGARPLIRSLVNNGIIASIGHSDATYEEAIEGIDAGIRHATHMFNAMSGMTAREPGVSSAVLSDDRVTADIILDLIHVHKALFALLLKSKNKDKVIIVTDSLAAIEKNRDLKNGDSPEQGLRLGSGRAEGQSPFFKAGGAYRFSDGRLAGSCLNMIGALKNVVRNCGLPLSDALKLITLNPAKLLGVESRKGEIVRGKDADIVIFDKEFDVKMTMIRGRIAYRKQ